MESTSKRAKLDSDRVDAAELVADVEDDGAEEGRAQRRRVPDAADAPLALGGLCASHPPHRSSSFHPVSHCPDLI